MKNRIEFASRWKRELYPASIADGKDAAYEISQRLKKGKSLSDARKNSWLDIETGKGFSDRAKKHLNDKIENSKNKGSFNKKKPKEKPTAPNQKDVLKTKKQKLLDAINEDLKEAQKKRANAPPKFEPPKFDYKFPKKPSRVSQLGKTLLKNKKKLALLAGAGTLGAVGYGLYRKARSDKGKKRRFYNK